MSYEKKEYDNTNRGSLFRNTKKESEKHPDMNGSLNVNGTEYWISGWTQVAKKDGQKFLSLSIKPKQDAPRQSNTPTRQNAKPVNSVQDMDDDLPF
jgi:hypothetical protein